MKAIKIDQSGKRCGTCGRDLQVGECVMWHRRGRLSCAQCERGECRVACVEPTTDAHRFWPESGVVPVDARGMKRHTDVGDDSTTPSVRASFQEAA